MDTNEHASSQITCGGDQDVASALGYPVTATLSFADRAPSPTCPFIKNQQCQRAAKQKKRTAKEFLDFGNRGTCCPIMLATDAVDGGSRQRRVGGAHLGAVRDSVNAFLNLF